MIWKKDLKRSITRINDELNNLPNLYVKKEVFNNNMFILNGKDLRRSITRINDELNSLPNLYVKKEVFNNNMFTLNGLANKFDRLLDYLQIEFFSESKSGYRKIKK